MAKYKQAIRIGKNVTDIMNLPCVVQCTKLNDKQGMEWLEYTIVAVGREELAEEGDWLIQTPDDHWTVMADEYFQKLMN